MLQSQSPAAPKELKMATPEILAGPWKISAGQPHAAGACLLQGSPHAPYTSLGTLSSCHGWETTHPDILP